MGKYGIPPQVKEGFKLISELSLDNVNILTSIFKAAKVGGDSYKDTYEKNKEKLQSIPEVDYKKILGSLTSLERIFTGSKAQIEPFAQEFSESYKDVNEGSDAKVIEALKKNLISLLHSYSYIKLTEKAHELLTGNRNNYYESRIISDIRMVFDDNDMKQKNQLAVIVHQLKIRYFHPDEKERDTFFISMDLKDLKELKNVIDRAIEKDSSIKNNNHNLEFIDLK